MFKLEWTVSGHEQSAFKQKRASLNLLCNSRSNSAATILPPKSTLKKSQNRLYIYIKNKNLFKEKVSQINKNQLKSIPNIKGRHIKHFLNQQK